jgi:hypothetical protein
MFEVWSFHLKDKSSLLNFPVVNMKIFFFESFSTDLYWCNRIKYRQRSRGGQRKREKHLLFPYIGNGSKDSEDVFWLGKMPYT